MVEAALAGQHDVHPRRLRSARTHPRPAPEQTRPRQQRRPTRGRRRHASPRRDHRRRVAGRQGSRRSRPCQHRRQQRRPPGLPAARTIHRTYSAVQHGASRATTGSVPVDAVLRTTSRAHQHLQAKVVKACGKPQRSRRSTPSPAGAGPPAQATPASTELVGGAGRRSAVKRAGVNAVAATILNHARPAARREEPTRPEQVIRGRMPRTRGPATTLERGAVPRPRRRRPHHPPRRRPAANRSSSSWLSPAGRTFGTHHEGPPPGAAWRGGRAAPRSQALPTRARQPPAPCRRGQRPRGLAGHDHRAVGCAHRSSRTGRPHRPVHR